MPRSQVSKKSPAKRSAATEPLDAAKEPPHPLPADENSPAKRSAPAASLPDLGTPAHPLRASTQALALLIAQHGPEMVDPATAARWREELGLSESRFRQLIRASRAKLHPLVEGVRQESLDDCARTLLALDGEAAASSRAVREEIIRARQHARFAQNRRPSPERAEMILWMTVWLENQPVFAEWLSRRRAVTAARSTPP